MAGTASASASFLKKHLWVVAFACSLCSLSLMVDPNEGDVAVAAGQPDDMILLQSGFQTRSGSQGPGIIWSNRDPYLDKDYPKDDQPGVPPEFTTEAPITPVDTAPAPSPLPEAPAPAPKLKVVPPPPGEQGPPWTWSQRDPYIDHDYPKDDQPTASPNLLQSASVNHARRDPAEKAKPAAEAKPAETQEAEESKAIETEKVEEGEPGSNLSPEDGLGDRSDVLPNETVSSVVPEVHVGENLTNCATRDDSRATSWFLETAPAGTPCVFGVDAQDEGKHCILGEALEYGSNGWCYTAEDKSQWGSCNANCPLQGPGAKLGNMLDGVAKTVQGMSEKVGSSIAKSSSTNVSQESAVAVGTESAVPAAPATPTAAPGNSTEPAAE